jgi:hypothetical protein
MQTYEFSLKLNRAVSAAEADALFAAGCDDGAIETGPAISRIDFDREAPSLAEAIVSAALDIEKVPGLQAVGVRCDDIVTLLDIAVRASVSREAVRLWATGGRGPGNFPEPMLTTSGGERFWDWSEVARWIAKHKEQLSVAFDDRSRVLRTADRVLAARAALAAEPDSNTRRELSELLSV